MGKILEVKNLKISFRTSGGTLKAVRDISFDLEKGETLAIVGESGSGKSVTSKAILGILAGNSIIEGGEILYDGKDLLKLSEEEMYPIRGDKVSMIFQDPLSSLDPIVKIGKQITEAMLLKNKANRKAARKNFNELLNLLKENILEAMAGDAAFSSEKIIADIKVFDEFNIEATKHENSYNATMGIAEELKSAIDDLLFMTEKHQKIDINARLKEIKAKALKINDLFATKAFVNEVNTFKTQVSSITLDKATAKLIRNGMYSTEKGMPDQIIITLESGRALLERMLEQVTPNFFCLGYYMMKNPDADLLSVPADELNAIARKYIDDEFMLEFLSYVEKGIKNSYTKALESKKAVLPLLNEAKKYFASADLEKSQATGYAGSLADAVHASIDKLEIVKDSTAYTFRSSILMAVNKYFYYKANNPKEEARFAKQTAKRDALIARGKKVDWVVVPKSVGDLDALKHDIISVIDRVIVRYTDHINASSGIDFASRSVDFVDYLKKQASDFVYKLTKDMAKEKALKLMEEVGISEPRKRYYQYPFEFSGGMRQRIVIAIALAANPDILICDEPTTALDVTIQAQILELINKLKQQRDLSVIFITHDLGVVANMADKIAVMYAGKIVEYGTADDIFYDPRHPYTWALLSSMPDLDTKEKLDAIPGTPPNMIYPPVGDAFADRNKYAMQIDFEAQPPFFDVSETHKAATWLLHPNAPAVEMPKIISDRIARMNKARGIDNAEQ